MIMQLTIAIVLVIVLVITGKKLCGKVREVEIVIDEKCERMICNVGEKLHKLIDKAHIISNSNGNKRLKNKIYGVETEVVNDNTLIMGRWAANVYNVYGKLYRKYPILINELDEETTITIGRSKSADISIGKDCEGHEYIGREHAIIKVENKSLLLKNNHSENGIIDENGNDVSEAVVTDGCVVTLSGLINIRFEEYGPVDFYLLTKDLEEHEYDEKHKYDLPNGTKTADGYVIL